MRIKAVDFDRERRRALVFVVGFIAAQHHAVEARPTCEGVVPQAADQGIVAGQTVEQVVIAAAGQYIGRRIADAGKFFGARQSAAGVDIAQIFNVGVGGQAVAGEFAQNGIVAAGVQSFGILLAHDIAFVDDVSVVTGTADQQVGAGTTIERVVAVTAGEHVG